jgi:hypothetical protein
VIGAGNDGGETVGSSVGANVGVKIGAAKVDALVGFTVNSMGSPLGISVGSKEGVFDEPKTFSQLGLTQLYMAMFL